MEGPDPGRSPSSCRGYPPSSSSRSSPPRRPARVLRFSSFFSFDLVLDALQCPADNSAIAELSTRTWSRTWNYSLSRAPSRNAYLAPAPNFRPADREIMSPRAAATVLRLRESPLSPPPLFSLSSSLRVVTCLLCLSLFLCAFLLAIALILFSRGQRNGQRKPFDDARCAMSRSREDCPIRIPRADLADHEDHRLFDT